MKHLNVVLMLLVCILVSINVGCSTFKKYQISAEEKVLMYLRENGTEKTDKYIDKLVAQDKLTVYQADKLKEIIHSALTRIEDVLAEKVEPKEPDVEQIPFCEPTE